MEHQKIFATNIFLLDNFIPQVTASEVSAVITMKKYISELWSQRDYDDNWQTKSANLHTKKEFKHLSSLIVKTGKDICKTQQNSKINNIVYSVTPNEKKNFDKNFHYLTDIDTIINMFIPNTRSGESHIFISYDGYIYVSVTTKLFQSYNNDFHKFSIIELLK